MTADRKGARSSRIAVLIEQAIAGGEFVPGCRMPAERDLAARWTVSRPTIREGISLLVAKGLLVRRHGDGTYVNPREDQRMAELWSDMVRTHPDLQADLIEFRQMLECTTAMLAAERHDESDLDALERSWRAVDQAYQQSDRRLQVKADVAFHRAIAEAAHNPVFSYLITSLLQLLYENVQLSIAGLTTDSQTATALREQHKAVFDAIQVRDGKRAATVANDHMEFVRTRLNDLERRRGRPPTRTLIR